MVPWMSVSQTTGSVFLVLNVEDQQTWNGAHLGARRTSPHLGSPKSSRAVSVNLVSTSADLELLSEESS